MSDVPESAEIPPEFGANPAPDWVVEWQLRLLPHGGRYRGRLFWGLDSAAGVQVEYPISRLREAVLYQVPLSDEMEGLLREILGASFSEGLCALPWQCRDGIPVEIIVHRRQPYHRVRTFCNLADAMGFLSLAGDTLVERWRAGAQPGNEPPPVVPLACLLADLTFSATR
jgi:hypothetical protein